ncbi:hypothetical protein B0H16DRAFT_1810579 [Mycena metata]|uniref:Uncharacterized protein n=1 Tax=Mycena metata TaxID=1033252 RepID=A0AAD7H6M5_9AGAR|nr:hypothetical protein B0H16DRAFT_1810579 [Mycena metata]
MSSLADLQGLLSKLEQLDLKSLDAKLAQQLQATTTAVKSTLDTATTSGTLSAHNAPPSGPGLVRTKSLDARDPAPSTIEFEGVSLGSFTPATTALPDFNTTSIRTPAPSSLEANKPPGEETPIREPRRAFPWVNLNPDDYPPPEKAYINREQRREFGMPLKGVLPLEPPLHLFQWLEESLSTRGKPDIERLVPAPPAEPPQDGCYPQAPEYVCNVEPDHSYRACYRLAAPFYPSEREELKTRMLDIRMPPKVTPTKFDMQTQSFIPEPIPGMVKLLLGFPLVHHINGDPKKAVTVVCAHTLETLMGYKEGPEVAALIPRLMELTWGKAASDKGPATPAVFQLPFMQKNLRSKHGAAMKGVVDGDGSFNLASAHGEGEGHGFFMPAVQTNTPEAAAILNEIRTILGKVYRSGHAEFCLLLRMGYDGICGPTK